MCGNVLLRKVTLLPCFIKKYLYFFPSINISLRITQCSLLIDKKFKFFSSKQRPSIFLLLILEYHGLQSLWNHRDISGEEGAMPGSSTLYCGKTVDHDVGMNLKVKVAASSLLNLTWTSSASIASLCFLVMTVSMKRSVV